MQYEGIDHVALAAPAYAAGQFEKLGLQVSPPYRLEGTGIERRLILTGPQSQPFGIALDAVVDEAEAGKSPFGRMALRAPGARGPVYALALRVADMQVSLDQLSRAGLTATPQQVSAHEGTKLCELAVLPEKPQAYAPLVLVQYARPIKDWHAECERAGMLKHSLDLKRLDHLATTAPEHDAAARFWREVLGIPQSGELTGGSGNLIRQFKVGDAIVELIGAATPESPARTRPPGLSSMTAFEVPDLEAAVKVARAGGFTISDPAVGALPGTRVSRIPAEELGGLGLQLLQYV